MMTMKIYPLILVCSALILVSGKAEAQKKKKALLVIVDGIAADVIEHANVPNLKEIADKGTYLRMYQGGDKGTYKESPTISAVGYNNVLTGVWYNKHNVPDNEIKAPNYHYPTLFRLLKDVQPEKSTAIFSSWEDNRTKLLGEGLAQTGGLKLDVVFDGYELDTVNFPHDEDRLFMMKIDSVVAQRASETIAEKAPDLSWVYMEYTDDIGHRYGDSPELASAVEKMDEAVGTIWKAVKEREDKFDEEWMLIVTTDHGRDEKQGKGHGGQSFRQRSAWVLSNQLLDNGYATSLYPSAVDIAPTIARFLELEVPLNVIREWDGVPLTGDVSIAQPQAHFFKNSLDLSWTPLKQDGSVKIWLSRTNEKKETGADDAYELLGTFPLSQKSVNIPLEGEQQPLFYKVVFETIDNSLNSWIF